MIKSLLSSVAVTAIMLGSALAQTNVESNANANANSQSGAVSGSQSGATATNRGNRQSITFNSPSNTTSSANNRDAVTYSGGTSNYSTSYGDQTIRTAPTVYAPPVSGGNPCTLAVSGGASFLGWGAAAGGTFVDEDCANRQKIAMIHNAGYAGAAKELMCNDRASYVAFKLAGQPCAFRASFEPQGAAPTPAPTPVTPPVMAPPPPRVSGPIPGPTNLPRCNARAGITDNCYSG